MFHPIKPRHTAKLFLLFWLGAAVLGQQAAPQDQNPSPATIRVRTYLVLVDVITQDPQTGLPVREFKSDDFRMFDNGNEVPITTFDAGARYDTRPVILWFVVICNEGGKIGGSAQFVGKEALFRPALDHLDNRDTVGVAHWCDNGEAQLDLLPTTDRDAPIRKLAETIKPIRFHIGGNSNFVGEATFRRMIRLIVQDAHRRNPEPLPVIVFLDGDHTGQPLRELNELVGDFLETSGIVFGIKDHHSPAVRPFSNAEQPEILHYMADKTGGQYFSAPPEAYAAALDMILIQLHFRYELGFKPRAIDGKRHALKVELTSQAQAAHTGVQLRFRPEYIPVSEEPAWAH